MKTTKTTKKVTKKTSKAKKPEFVVDMTTAETPLEIAYEEAQGKVRAGLPISQQEADTIEKVGFFTACDVVQSCVDELDAHTTYIEDDKLAEKLLKEIKKHQAKKAPWYKRFWRTITFRKNK